MTHRRSWKKSEQRIAEALGGRRVPLSGQNSGHNTQADVLDVPEYVECKLMPESGAWTDLSDLDKAAKRYDRVPVLLYDLVDGPSWLAMWFDRYVDDRWSTGKIDLPHLTFHQWSEKACLRHRVGKRLPHAALVRDTVEKAENEDRLPLVVIQKKHSSRQVALVPFIY